MFALVRSRMRRHPGEDDPVGRLFVEIEFVDLRIQPVVVRTQGPQDAPDHAIAFVVVQRLFRFHARRNKNRQDNVAVFLALCLPHRPSHRLHDVHVALARIHEQDGVQRRHVDTLGQASRIRENAASTRRFALQPFDPGLAVQGVMLPVHMLRFATESPLLLAFRQQRNGLLNDAFPMFLQLSGRFDNVRKGDRPLQAQRFFMG